MTIEHRNISDPEIHEIKGASTAVADSVPVADGGGSHDWTPVSELFGAADFTIENIFEGNSFSEQTLTNTDTVHQITFGSEINNGSDPAQLSSAGVVTFNETGLYRVKVVLQYGKGSGGTSRSLFHFRGVINGSPASPVKSSTALVDETKLLIFEYWRDFTSADQLHYEVVLDSSQAGNGRLRTLSPSTTGWDDSPSARIVVDRFIGL